MKLCSVLPAIQGQGKAKQLRKMIFFWCTE
jgi:hypothetical protein